MCTVKILSGLSYQSSQVQQFQMQVLSVQVQVRTWVLQVWYFKPKVAADVPHTNWGCVRLLIKIYSDHSLGDSSLLSRQLWVKWDSVNRFISLEVNLLVKFIKHNQNYYLKFDVSTSVRGLRHKKLVLSSPDSGHDGKMPCQESGRMPGSVGSCPHHGSWPAVLSFGCVRPPWSIW